MRRLHNSWYWLAPVGFAIALGAYAQRQDLAGLYDEYRYSQDEVRQLEMRLEEVSAREQALKQHVEDLDTNDPLAVEAEIRRSKGLVREDEKIYRIELPPVAAPQSKQAQP
jgi:cell division protein FtsB